jgi:protease PrsW
MVFVAIAVLPAILLITWLYMQDKIHPEPKRAVYRLFLLGAAVVLPAGLLEQKMMNADLPHSTGVRVTLMTAFFVAGMIEEFLKAAVFERAALQKGLIKYPIDAIVYAGAVGLGFATVENILYVTSSGFSTALLRSVTAVPAHFMFAILMGHFFAESVWNQKRRALGYIVPAIAHGIYDSFALSNGWLMDVFLVIYLLILMEISLRLIDKAKQLHPAKADMALG